MPRPLMSGTEVILFVQSNSWLPGRFDGGSMAPIRWRLVGCQGPLWSTCASSMMMWRFGHRTEDIFEIQPHVHSAFRTVSNLIPMQCLGSDLQRDQHSRGVAITLLAAQFLVPVVRPLPRGQRRSVWHWGYCSLRVRQLS